MRYKKFFLIAVLALGMAFQPASLDAKKKDVRVQFGDKWTGKSGKKHEARIYIDWSITPNRGQKFIREPALDEEASNLNKGIFPISPFKLPSFGATVYVELDIALNGNIKNCTVKKQRVLFASYAGHDKEEPKELVQHACPHLKKHAVFHPPLALNGERIPVKGIFGVRYVTGLPQYVQVVYRDETGNEVQNQRDVTPASEITIESLGLTSFYEELKGKRVSMWVDVDGWGKAGSCNLFGPTFVDAVDRVICDRVKDQKFLPTIDYKGKTRAEQYLLRMTF